MRCTYRTLLSLTIVVATMLFDMHFGSASPKSKPAVIRIPPGVTQAEIARELQARGIMLPPAANRKPAARHNAKYATSPELTLKQLVHLVMPSMVRITVLNKDGVPAVQGSGFVVGPNLIATNYHVVKGAHSVTANFDNGRSEQVDGIVGADKSYDLVVLHASTKGIRPLLLRCGPLSMLHTSHEEASFVLGIDSGYYSNLDNVGDNLPQLADQVVAFGSPDGLSNTISTGIVSGLRSLNGMSLIQTTCPISHGSSGGALVDMTGHVVGITALFLSDGQNLNFAYPDYYLRQILALYPTGVVTWAEMEQRQQQLNADLANLLSSANNLKITGSDVKVKLENAVEAGSDLNVRSNDKSRTTALMASVLLNSPDCVRLLLDHGAEVNAQDTNGTTALYWAALMEQDDIIKLLLADGANPNLKDYDGDTPIMNCIGGPAADADGKATSCASILIAHGADVNAKNNDGKTPLMLARFYKLSHVAELLVNAGATDGMSWTNYTTISGLVDNRVSSVYVAGPDIYVGTLGGLSVSTNSGASWTNYTVSNGLGSNSVNAVVANGNYIYVGTTHGLSVSTDGGSSWTNYTTAAGLTGNDIFSIAISGGTFCVGTNNAGLSVQADNHIISSYTASNGLGSNVVNSVYISGATYYAGTSGGLSISSDGGASWTNFTTTNGMGSNLVNGVFVDESGIYAATMNGLSVSSNAGTSWTNYTTTNGLAANDVECVTVSGSNICAGTYNGGISISTNGGSSWENYTSTNGLVPGMVDSIVVSGSTIYVGAEGGLSVAELKP